MAFELIITSVRKGLDGGSGYQPVLRTKDLKPAIAERLQLRSGYSHPFPHGDRRNPVVYVHRIERVAGETVHVIARICDAGSDHTGRSNFLAHFVAMNEPEARKKAAGPAEITRRMPFKTSWDEPAREATAPTVVGGDRQPGPCRAWEAAGHDPGIAGDLAAAAMAGREVTLVSRDTDDVLALFADAMALVAPAKRWQVTFNTCRIEPFEGTWQAIRGDLPQAKDARSMPGVIDLTKGPRGGDGPYAAYARGTATVLPWQQTDTQAGNSFAPTGPRSQEPARGVQSQPVAAKGSESPRPPVAAMAAPISGASPRPKRRPGNTPRDAFSPADAAEGSTTAWWPLWVAMALFGIVPIGLALAVGLRLLPLPWWDKGTSVAQLPPDTSDGPPSSEDLEERERQRREREEKKKAEQKRKEQEEQEKRDADERAKLEEQKQQETQRQAADAAKAAEAARQAEAQRKKDAFAALKKLPAIIPKDLLASDTGGGTKATRVDLGTIDIDSLLDLGFSLAIPEELYEGQRFDANIEAVPGETKWSIMASSKDVDTGKQFRASVATLEARAGTLSIAADETGVKKSELLGLLRCSVLLVKARDPEKPAGAAAVQHTIQLVRPGTGKMKWENISLLAESTRGKLPRPNVARLPKNAVIKYTVRFPYPRKYVDGKPLPEPVSQAFESAEFCPLLDCPPPDPNKPNETPVVGLDVSVSIEKAAIEFTPGVRPEEAAQIGKWAEWLNLFARGTNKRLEEEFKHQEQYWDRQLDAMDKLPLEKFVNSPLSKTILPFVESSQPLIEECFKRSNSFPPPKDKDGKEIPDNKTRYQRWEEKWRPMATTGKGKDQDWKKVFGDELRKCLDSYCKERRKALSAVRAQLLDPLNAPVEVEVTEFTSQAVADDGTRYSVILAKPGESTGHATTTTDIN